MPPACPRARGGGRRPAGARHHRPPRLCGRYGDAVRRSVADVRGLVGRWDRDEWDVSLSDGAAYRIFQDRASDAWFVDAIVD